MVENYYLNEDLYFNDKQLFKVLHQKNVKLNKKNWYKYLKDYGWEKISKDWMNKLDSNYICLLECGSDGDCLFHVICEALNLNLIYIHKIPEYEIGKLRIMCSEQIKDDNFNIILESYKAEVESLEFFGEWDPNLIDTKEDLQLEIIKHGNNFWGDHILMQLLSSKLEINFVILSDNLNVNVINNELKYDKTIFIYFLDKLHFQLIGYFNGRFIETLFNNNEIPICFSRLIRSYLRI